MRVLIAEDSAITRLVLQGAVTRLGHECRVAEDGEAAWEAFLAHGADVIISDWMMPRLDGATLCRRVRAHAAAPYTYFMFVTVLEDKQHALAGMEAGADDYLTKPLDLDDLAMRLVAAARVTALHRSLAERDAERERTLRRQEGVLRLARRFAAESSVDQLLGDLVREAVAVLEAKSGTLGRWDAQRSVLVPQYYASPPDRTYVDLLPGQGAAGRALATRATVILNDYSMVSKDEIPGTAFVQAAIATPLLYEGELLGALTVHTDLPGKKFSDEEGQTLELIASLGAAALVGIERARLDGVLLGVRTMEHELNNQLTLTRGYSELIARDRALPAHLRTSASEALRGAQAASAILNDLREITHLQERQWGARLGSTLDLPNSPDQP